MVYFTAIRHSLWPFRITYGNFLYFPVLVCCTEKILATLMWMTACCSRPTPKTCPSKFWCVTKM
jgi:hypothetical protein